jgi:hypothetical protein
VLRQEALWAKSIRVSPKPSVTVHDPRRDHDLRAFSHRLAVKLVRAERLAPDEWCRRVEAHRFLDDGRRIDQLP